MRRTPPYCLCHTGSDIAWEMRVLVKTFQDCKTCQKACVAAVDMLAVSFKVVNAFIDPAINTEPFDTSSINVAGYPGL